MVQPLERSAFACFSCRLAAGTIDWLIVFAALWAAAIIATALRTVPLLLSFLVSLLYFAVLWMRNGQTVGMRTKQIKMVETQTWEPPSWIRASLRALVAVITFTACGLPLVVGFADAPASRAIAILAVSLTIVALALIGHLWALRDPCRQSLQDRLFGLAVVHAKPSRATDARDAGQYLTRSVGRMPTRSR